MRSVLLFPLQQPNNLFHRQLEHLLLQPWFKMDLEQQQHHLQLRLAHNLFLQLLHLHHSEARLLDQRYLLVVSEALLKQHLVRLEQDQLLTCLEALHKLMFLVDLALRMVDSAVEVDSANNYHQRNHQEASHPGFLPTRITQPSISVREDPRTPDKQVRDDE